MAFCRVDKNDFVIEVWDVAELPPLTQEITDLYIPCDATVQEGYQQTSPGVFEPYVPPIDVEALRLEVINSIKKHGANLMAAQIDAFQDFDTVGLIAELWPTIDTTQASQALLYCKDVYLFGRGRIQMAQTADQATLEGYNVTADNWPSVPA